MLHHHFSKGKTRIQKIAIWWVICFHSCRIEVLVVALLVNKQIKYLLFNKIQYPLRWQIQVSKKKNIKNIRIFIGTNLGCHCHIVCNTILEALPPRDDCKCCKHTTYTLFSCQPLKAQKHNSLITPLYVIHSCCFCIQDVLRQHAMQSYESHGEKRTQNIRQHFGKHNISKTLQKSALLNL